MSWVLSNLSRPGFRECLREPRRRRPACSPLRRLRRSRKAQACLASGPPFCQPVALTSDPSSLHRLALSALPVWGRLPPHVPSSKARHATRPPNRRGFPRPSRPLRCHPLREEPDLGRLPGSTRWGLVALAVMLAAVYAVAARLEPDPKGYGTHTQLGLPPCHFAWVTGAPVRRAV